MYRYLRMEQFEYKLIMDLSLYKAIKLVYRNSELEITLQLLHQQKPSFNVVLSNIL
jgi:hypothetical protein